MNGTGWNHSASQSQPRQPYTTLLLVVACLLLGSAGCAPAVNQPVSGRLPTPPHGMSRAPAPTVQPHGDHAAPRLRRPIPVVIQPPRPFRVAVADAWLKDHTAVSPPTILPVAGEQPATVPSQFRPVPAATPTVAAAVRETFADYLADFNRHDPVALAAHWTVDGENLDLDTGSRTRGRPAMEQVFTRLFQITEDAALAVDIEAVRPLHDDVVLVDGLSRLTIPGQPSSHTRFSAVLVRHDERWLIETVREAAATAERTVHDRLADLAWLRGSWEDISDGVTVSLQCDWNETKTFLIRRHFVTVDPEPRGAAARLAADVPALLPVDAPGDLRRTSPTQWTVTEYIGWHAPRGEIRSWLFCSDGQAAEWRWLRTPAGWLLEDAAVGTATDNNAVLASPMQLGLEQVGSDEMTVRLEAGNACPFVPVADFMRTARPVSAVSHP